jgi:hypothetical protein
METDLNQIFEDIRYKIPVPELGLEKSLEIGEKLQKFLEESSVEMYLSNIKGVSLYSDVTMLIPLEIDGYRLVYPVTLSGR